jgi:hypothetical protein
MGDEAMGNDHWHTLEGMRSCPDKCMPEDVIANLERTPKTSVGVPSLYITGVGLVARAARRSTRGAGSPLAPAVSSGMDITAVSMRHG